MDSENMTREEFHRLIREQSGVDQFSFEQLSKMEEIIGYTFSNRDYLSQAFIRSSYAKEGNATIDNEQLEFLGDKVLDFVITKKLLSRYRESSPFSFELCRSEEELTELRQMLVCNETLGQAIEQVGLNRFLRMGKGDVGNHVEEGTKVSADLFEAILGAVTVDSNWSMDAVEAVVDRLLQPEKRLAEGLWQTHVNSLFDWYAKTYGKEPTLEIKERNGRFTCNIVKESVRRLFGDVPILQYVGVGPTKTEAIEHAAREMMREQGKREQNKNQFDGLIDLKEPLRTLNQLHQLNFIPKPEFVFSQSEQIDPKTGNAIWECYCTLASQFVLLAPSKQQAKNDAAKATLLYLTDQIDFF